MHQFENTGYFQKQRLEFIEFLLEYFDHFSRQDLIKFFGCGPASATRDIALYKKVASDNLKLSFDSTKYLRTDSFSPVFEHCSNKVIYNLIWGFTGTLSNPNTSAPDYQDLREVNLPDCRIIGIVSRAISNNSKVGVCLNDKRMEICPISLSLCDDGYLKLTYSIPNSDIENTVNLLNSLIQTD